jgi:hypothetical protein
MIELMSFLSFSLVGTSTFHRQHLKVLFRDVVIYLSLTIKPEGPWWLE